jgi:hypothetical protein
MARGRHTSLSLSLTQEQRQALQAWLRSTNLPAGKAKRARVILAVDAGRSISDISRSIPIARRLVYKWTERFLAGGIAGLADNPRSGRPPAFSPGSGNSCGQNRLRAA